MARADSTIRVNIIGDAKSLTRAADTSQSAIGGMNKKILAAGGIIAGAFATDQIVDFAQTALKEADRVGDASDRLKGQLGELADPLIAAADEFSKLGASEGDMLDLEARFADIGTAAGIADTKLAPFAQSAAELASKMALATDTEADVWITKIGKAAASDDGRALRELGINLSDAAVAAQALADTGKGSVDALTAAELAAARSELILADLEERYGTVGEGAGDLESKQRDLGARFETFQGQVGETIEGPLTELLGMILTLTDWFGTAADTIEAAGIEMDKLLAPVKSLIAPWTALGDAISGAVDALAEFLSLSPTGIGTPLPRGSATPLRSRQYERNNVTVTVQGGSPEAIEQAVRDALRTAAGRGPLE